MVAERFEILGLCASWCTSNLSGVHMEKVIMPHCFVEAL